MTIVRPADPVTAPARRQQLRDLLRRMAAAAADASQEAPTKRPA